MRPGVAGHIIPILESFQEEVGILEDVRTDEEMSRGLILGFKE